MVVEAHLEDKRRLKACGERDENGLCCTMHPTHLEGEAVHC